MIHKLKFVTYYHYRTLKYSERYTTAIIEIQLDEKGIKRKHLVHWYNEKNQLIEDARKDNLEKFIPIYYYEYDANGNCVCRRNHNNEIDIEYTYDDKNRRTSINYPLCEQPNIIKYEYNENDCIVCDIRHNNTFRYTYDDHNNAIRCDDNKGCVWYRKNKYDKNNRLIKYIEYITTNNGKKFKSKITFKYDKNGNIIKKTDKDNGQVNIITYKYDSNNRCIYEKSIIKLCI